MRKMFYYRTSRLKKKKTDVLRYSSWNSGHIMFLMKPMCQGQKLFVVLKRGHRINLQIHC